MKRLLAALFIVVSNPSLAVANDDATQFSAAFVFGGALTADDIQRSASPLAVDYDGNGIFGGGFQSYFVGLDWVRLGGEAGLALRLGQSTTGGCGQGRLRAWTCSS